MRLIIIIFTLMLFTPVVYSATIYGTIYDFSLDKAKDIRVEIDTEPRQFYISKNGSYAFNVPNGDYKIEAKQYFGDLLRSSVSEDIAVKDDGTYVLDLILFPNVEEDELEGDIDIVEPFPERELKLIPLLILALFLAIAFLVYTKIRKRPVKEKTEEKEDIDLNRIIKIIKEEGGRTTQKHIRKQIPLSEAKISLMIDELEHKGVIEKIKKGRGNIIILKSKTL